MKIETIIQRLIYEPETGFFIWRNGPNAGRRAGHANSRGYRHIKIGDKYVKEHRAAFVFMTGAWPEDVVDHINRQTGDNRWSNLRDVCAQDNALNSGACGAEPGVHCRKDGSAWEAKGMLRGKRIHLGRFPTRDQARAARHQFITQKAAGRL
jgi:hypothetical protein